MVKEDEHWHLVEEDRWSIGIGSQKDTPKLCSICHVSTSVMYCKAHEAHLCRACDAKIHGNGNRDAASPTCHEREWLCDVCEQAPAVVTCRADAASLCVNCDNHIHSANPLAERHERLPVVGPFVNGFSLDPNPNNLDCNNFLNEDGGEGQPDDPHNEDTNNLSHQSPEEDHREEGSYQEEGTISWMIPETNKRNMGLFHGISGEDSSVKDKLKFKAYVQSMDFIQDVDSCVDLGYLPSTAAATTPIFSPAGKASAHLGTDSMVPVHTPEVYDHLPAKVSNESGGSLDLDAYKSNYGYRTGSLSHCIPSSSVATGIVPESDGRSFQLPQVVSQVGDQAENVGREAKVLRYREKRKNRKFEKTIRYASRKAYAETRPRIKGRFAKRSDADIEQIYTSSLLPDQKYDAVSTF
eukprot:TRINITY_DN3781_c0_g1_i1.p1 TRINITY_DN3781_c0_g1~~TRINITY_DN3781_c0_g1_i1.p1  ORF type:complete len:410 (+),score=89.31 TRINITY_DN3781_c0_g1_i1:120-1349(+)